uniref:Uncharacterized protein n=1 Tax=Noctiluca scintillans TaxID=2966 RepID=A0A7S1AQU0_NOCSC|mmetsp:Transcript_55821/g.148863  ORF Transcript_55821/g.148863 Transcript_55821/m.148863 type:complete len:268 (+) Transcript_55821:62-865(+)
MLVPDSDNASSSTAASEADIPGHSWGFEKDGSVFNARLDVTKNPPRFTLTSKAAVCTAEDVDALTVCLSKCLEYQTSYVCVYDIRVFKVAPLGLAKRLGDYCSAHQSEFDTVQLGIAIILPNSFIARFVKSLIGVITAVAPPKCPLNIVNTDEEAEAMFAQLALPSCTSVKADNMPLLTSEVGSGKRPVRGSVALAGVAVASFFSLPSKSVVKSTRDPFPTDEDDPEKETTSRWCCWRRRRQQCDDGVAMVDLRRFRSASDGVGRLP